ncbi:MAG: HEAT repeat domain-containing protein [Myxococcota bacterium]
MIRRSLSFALLLVSLVSFGKPNQGLEAQKVLSGFLEGSIGLNQAINRIQFLGYERPVCHELLMVLKRTGDKRKREQILEFVASIAVRDKDVEESLVGMLSGDEAGELMLAARGLARLESAAAVKPLIGLLGHQVFGVRREATRALGEIGKPAATAPLLQAAKTEQDLELKLLMITSAGKAGDRKQVPAFEALLKDGSESTRQAAAQALCLLGAAKGVQFASRLLASADRHERMQGVMLFEGASAKVASPVLAPVLADKDDRVRARAARILVQGGDAARLEWLVLESARAQGEVRLIYEDELERLRLSDEQRQAILKKAGAQ